MKKSNDPNNNNSPSRYGFEIFFKEDEKYYFRFNDMGGEPLLFGKGYNSKHSCENGIQAIIRAAGNDEQYELKKTKKGKYFFILKSGNYKQIGRSRSFDTMEELEEKLKFLKSIEEDIPQYDLTEPLPETKDEVSEEKEEAAKNSEKKESPPEVADKQPSHSGEPEKMPRYKFSVIYYPDSKIWTIKNDFSGGSLKLKTWDSQKIEAFLSAQLPPGEMEAKKPAVTPKEPEKEEAPAQPKEPIQKEPEAKKPAVAPKEPEKEEASAQLKPVQKEPEAEKPAVTPKEPVKKEAPPQPKKTAWEEVELNILTYQGEPIQKVAKKDKISKVELSIRKVRGEVQPQAFEAMVKARSIKDNQTILLGIAKEQNLVDGRLEVFISRAKNLQPGPYIFIANVYQSKQGKQPEEYYGSQIIVLN